MGDSEVGSKPGFGRGITELREVPDVYHSRDSWHYRDGALRRRVIY